MVLIVAHVAVTCAVRLSGSQGIPEQKKKKNWDDICESQDSPTLRLSMRVSRKFSAAP